MYPAHWPHSHTKVSKDHSAGQFYFFSSDGNNDLCLDLYKLHSSLSIMWLSKNSLSTAFVISVVWRNCWNRSHNMNHNNRFTTVDFCRSHNCCRKLINFPEPEFQDPAASQSWRPSIWKQSNSFWRGKQLGNCFAGASSCQSVKTWIWCLICLLLSSLSSHFSYSILYSPPSLPRTRRGEEGGDHATRKRKGLFVGEKSFTSQLIQSV